MTRCLFGAYGRFGLWSYSRFLRGSFCWAIVASFDANLIGRASSCAATAPPYITVTDFVFLISSLEPSTSLIDWNRRVVFCGLQKK